MEYREDPGTNAVYPEHDQFLLQASKLGKSIS